MPTEALSCPTVLDPVCQVVGGVGSTVTGSLASDVLGALSEWVVNGASWLLGQVGHLLATTTAIDLGAGWFTSHYRVMAGLGALVLLPLLLLSIVQAVYRQSAAGLVRLVLVQVPLAALLTAVAVQLVRLGLTVTDGLSSSVAASAGGDIQQVLSGVAAQLSGQSATGDGSVPAFVLLLGALLVALGAFALWVELLVRAAAVYVAVLFLPLALASLVWPPIAHWCRRLVDTLAALILSKFVIVAVLSLATGAMAAGSVNGFSSVLEAGAMLLLATFVPFTILRLVPAVEAGAVHHLEDTRRRVSAAVTATPRTAAAYALRAARLASFEPGTAGFEGAADAAPRGGPSLGLDSPVSAGGPGATGAVSSERPAGRSGRSAAAAGSWSPSSGAVPSQASIGEWSAQPDPLVAFASIARGSGPLSGQESAASALPAGWSGRTSTDMAPATLPFVASGIEGSPDEEPRGRPEPPRWNPPGRGSLVLDRDELGPRIRWVPPEGRSGPPAVDADGERGDGR